jgi:phosphoglycolate phosphatase
MPIRRYRHVIWDWNGTLPDDVAFSIQVMNGLLAQHRLPLLDRARYLDIFDFPVRTSYKLRGQQHSAAAMFHAHLRVV